MSIALDLVAWLATYALHSTIVLGLAYLVTRRLHTRPAWSALVWRVAIITPLLTTCASGLVTLTEPMVVSSSISTPSKVAETRAWSSDSGALRLDATPVVSVDSEADPVSETLPRPTQAMLVPDSRSFATPALPLLAGLGVLLWIAVAAMAAIGVMRARRALGRMLSGAQPIRTGPLWELFQAVASRAAVTRRAKLALAPRVGVPMVVGHTVYVPPRAFGRLDRSAQLALLAHELGHVAHADPLWRWVSIALERVFWFQPLHRLATRELAAASELLADAWAASQTREPLELARCLTEVAGWMAPPRRLSPAPTASEPRSILARRVHSLMAFESEGTAAAATSRWGSPTLAVAVALLCLTLPRVVSGHQPQDPQRVQVVLGELPLVLEPGEDEHVVVLDDAVVVERTRPSAKPAPPRAERKRQRRTAKKRVRKAFRDAKRRGEAHPSAEELRRAVGVEARESTSSLVIVIDGDRVEIAEGPSAWRHRATKTKRGKRAKRGKKAKRGRRQARRVSRPGAVELDFGEGVVNAAELRARVLEEAARMEAESALRREQVLRATEEVLRQRQRELEERRRILKRELDKERRRSGRPDPHSRGVNDIPSF